MLTSKVTSKGQVTLPKALRDQLDVKPGDVLAFDVVGRGSAVVRKAQPFDRAWHRSLQETLSEWQSPEDAEDFGDL